MKTKPTTILAAALLILAACSVPPPKVALEPDAGFGSGGVAAAPDAGPPGSGDVAYRLLRTNDRFLLVGHGCATARALCGISDQSNWTATAWGFDPGGTPDAGFGTGGVFRDGDAAGGNSTNVAFGAALTDAGPVLAGGGLNASGDLDAVLWALDDAGQLDTARFGAGKALLGDLTAAGAHDFVEAVRAGTGRFWLAGGIQDPAVGHYQPAVWAVGSDGSPDAAFDGDGVFVAGTSDTAWFNDLDLTQGAPVAVGAELQGSARPIAMKVRPEGGLDPDFGTGGRVDLPLGGYSTGEALAVQVADDAIVVAGYVDDGDGHVALWRLSPEGAVETDFGDGGLLVLDGRSPANYYDARVGLVLEGHRYWVVAGLENSSGDLDMAIWRVLPSGEPDPDFCGGGPCTFAGIAGGNGDDWGNDLLLDGNTVYVGGWSWSGGDRDAVIWKLDVTPTR
ncbi:hypothetical protein [Oceanithermus desulfurans]|uniref:Uncharacterized protein n=2 Tax=Oceanithermus desulfurans TaxID=227924 RepID=A0A511RJW8_9DEIN|nr:hypothetical protein [Oceanithermus desulfurans]MBB6029403.1 putative delta-60 repeat protein [Oceanithermus desulfurans]GEM89941.1 hypothetical protein ODE01S_13750 [Oceanithermus desulfurans NBRC 100063]